MQKMDLLLLLQVAQSSLQFTKNDVDIKKRIKKSAQIFERFFYVE
jgi:hypothetical protein